ncbi:hypothetical protein NPIL_12201, partial [Nephila pilipes]
MHSSKWSALQLWWWVSY